MVLDLETLFKSHFTEKMLKWLNVGIRDTSGHKPFLLLLLTDLYCFLALTKPAYILLKGNNNFDLLSLTNNEI